MRKWTLKFLTALSLAALVATGLVYAQSFFQMDDLSAQWATLKGPDATLYRAFVIASRGRVDCFFIRYKPTMIFGLDQFETSVLPWQHSFSLRVVRSRGVNLEYLDPGTRSGFSFTRGHHPCHYSEFEKGLVGMCENYATAIVPLWLPMALFGAAPAAWLIRILWPGIRRRQGGCQGCGYDLRASTDRCPECGRRIAIVAAASREISWRRRSPACAAAAAIVVGCVVVFAGARIVDGRQEIITRQIEVNRDFWKAVISDNTDSARAALSRGANIDLRGSDGQWALLHAVTSKHSFSLIRFLVEAGTDPNFHRFNCNYGPLDFAVRDGRADVVELLLKAGANPGGAQSDDNTPLTAAICDETIPNRDRIACLLIAHGAPIKQSLFPEWSPIFSAVVSHCHSGIISAMIQRGADWRADDHGANLLSIAFVSKNYEAAQLLIDLGADTSKADDVDLKQLKQR